MVFIERKPDFETESFRLWKATASEKAAEALKSGFRINYKGMEVQLCGFTLVRDTESGEVIFAFREEEKRLLYWAKDEDSEQTKELLARLSAACKEDGVQLVSYAEALESLHAEKHVLGRL